MYRNSFTRVRSRLSTLPGQLAWFLPGLLLFCLLLNACSVGLNNPTTSITPTSGSSSSGTQSSFPSGAPPLRVPAFGTVGQVAPTVKVLASINPTLIVQFPLIPSGLKKLYPDASGQVTVIEGIPGTSVLDTLTVTVQKMPPNQKFTIFFTEISAKPFGHAEYVGDVFTREDGSGESVVHLIVFVAFAADARNPGTSIDQSGEASGIQLEHVGLWFDGVIAARQVLHDPALPGTPFDGGFGVSHAGPQAMTDGQTLPVI